MPQIGLQPTRIGALTFSARGELPFKDRRSKAPRTSWASGHRRVKPISSENPALLYFDRGVR